MLVWGGGAGWGGNQITLSLCSGVCSGLALANNTLMLPPRSSQDEKEEEEDMTRVPVQVGNYFEKFSRSSTVMVFFDKQKIYQ